MTIVRRVIYDWKGNPIKVNDYDVTGCEYHGEQGVFVRDVDETPNVAVKDDGGNKEIEHINNFEYSRSLAGDFLKSILKKA